MLSNLLGILGFQNPGSQLMEGIVELHHNIIFYMIIVVVLVSWMLFSIINDFCIQMYWNLKNSDINSLLTRRFFFRKTQNIVHLEVLEIVWTITPSLVLVMIAMPSFSLLYTIDELMEPVLTIKVIGHQWYWSYELTDFYTVDKKGIMFDSYMVTENDLPFGRLRLLEVDKKLWCPTNVHIRFIVTSVDVLHCFALPAFGIKMDAVPGRLNQIGVYIAREGLFYGQCSEICGVNHGFMPIAVKAVEPMLFNEWVKALIFGK